MYLNSLYYQAFLRGNRALAATFINPSHPIESIACSEIISTLEPLFNPRYYNQILSLIFILTNIPDHKLLYIDFFVKKNLQNIQGEICCLLLFILINSLQYVN